MKDTTPFAVGDPIPKVCRVSDVCRICQWSDRRFYELLAEQRLPFPEIKPRVCTPRFRGEDVERWINGGYEETRTAGRSLRLAKGTR